MSNSSKVTLREVQIEDYELFEELKKRVGLSSDSREYWEHLWNNPTFQEEGIDLPHGWFLMDGEKAVGHIGNMPHIFFFEEKKHIAATSTAMGVDSKYRAYSILLADTFFKQKNVDLLITTGIESVCKLFEFLKGKRIPQHDYNQVLYWVLEPSQFIESGLRSKGQTSYPILLGGKILGSPLFLFEQLYRKFLFHNQEKLHLTQIDPSEIGHEFEMLWERKKTEQERLQFFRNSVLLRWHYNPPAKTFKTKIICCHDDGRLVGYAALRSEFESPIGLIRSKIVDLIAERDDPEIVNHLFRGCYRSARESGCGVIEVIGFPRVIRDCLDKYKPYKRYLPSFPYICRIANKQLAEKLEDEKRWYSCLYETDGAW